MKKFKVKFQLMVDPGAGDETFNQSYTVEALDEKEALRKAEELKDKEEPYISKRSVFNQFIKEIK